jgi:hypothetical protein
MLESINVRFFCYEQTEGPFEPFDIVEIGHQEFVDLHSIAPSARIDHELYTIFANGVRQFCITINAERETGSLI